MLELFRQVELVRNEDQSLSLWFWIQNQKLVLTLEQFAQILQIPSHRQCAYTEDWSLESLFNYREENSHYCSYIPYSQEITCLLCTPQLFNYLNTNKIRLVELFCVLQPMAVILRENVLSLKGNHERLSACCAEMLYCLFT